MPQMQNSLSLSYTFRGKYLHYKLHNFFRSRFLANTFLDIDFNLLNN